jgi:hypothetical protein
MCEQCQQDSFTDMELASHAGETSETYEAAMLSAAVRLVTRRHESLEQLAKRMEIGKSTLYRWARGERYTRRTFERAILLLAVTREYDAA